MATRGSYRRRVKAIIDVHEEEEDEEEEDKNVNTPSDGVKKEVAK